MSRGTTHTAATTALGPAIAAPIAAADWLRRRWLRALGGLGRALVRQRELRVAAVFSLVITTAMIGALIAPFWLLMLGPLIWGVPHLVADLRYLVVRSGVVHRRAIAWIGGATLLWMGTGGGVGWGFVGAAAVALLARAGLGRRLIVAAILVALAAWMLGLGRAADVVFGHAHNFVAVAIWWAWRPRVGRLHWIPIGLLIAAVTFILVGPSLALAEASGGLGWFGADMGPQIELWRLAPGLGPELGLRLVLLFCFAQSVHYALWLHLVADEDRARTTPPTFRASLAELRADLGDAGVVIAGLIAVGIALWAAIDLADANAGYFRMARFHGHLEVMALALLALEGRAMNGVNVGALR